jgi:hypothetical protein
MFFHICEKNSTQKIASLHRFGFAHLIECDDVMGSFLWFTLPWLMRGVVYPFSLVNKKERKIDRKAKVTTYDT